MGSDARLNVHPRHVHLDNTRAVRAASCPSFGEFDDWAYRPYANGSATSRPARSGHLAFAEAGIEVGAKSLDAGGQFWPIAVAGGPTIADAFLKFADLAPKV